MLEIVRGLSLVLMEFELLLVSSNGREFSLADRFDCCRNFSVALKVKLFSRESFEFGRFLSFFPFAGFGTNVSILTNFHNSTKSGVSISFNLLFSGLSVFELRESRK